MLIRKLIIGSAFATTLLLTGCEAVVTNAGYYDYGYPGYYRVTPVVGYYGYGGPYYRYGYRGYRGYRGNYGYHGYRGHAAYPVRHGGHYYRR